MSAEPTLQQYMVHLHTRSWFSFRAGGSSPEALVRAAAERGVEALALTDRHGVYGAVRLQQACERHGVRPIFGAEVDVEGEALVLLAMNRQGYGNLCRLLTAAHAHSREAPEVTFEELEAFAGDLFCLTGTYASRLWRLVDARRPAAARAWLRQLRHVFGDRLSVELASHGRPDDRLRLGRLATLAEETGIEPIAAGDVRHATRADYRRYDLLTCIRLGQSVFDPSPQRPRNAEGCLRGEAALRRVIPHGRAFDRARDVAAACRVDLLPGRILPPPARYDAVCSAYEYLRGLCERELSRWYGAAGRAEARAQLERELEVIGEARLADFFLVVREVTEAARRRGIRCAGRGSAAGSLVCYLLGITRVDPLRHNLLFERFLHRGRKGTPDIDVDFESDRRDEVIDWMERRFGIEQTAMTATVVSYRLRSALRDVAKALGFAPEQVDRLAKAVPRRSAHHATGHRGEIERAVGRSRLTEALIRQAAGLEGCPRHLGLHSGGMILSARPLWQMTPVQTSANGVRMVQFDKDDAEALGLVKLDVLGLRMLSTLSEAEQLVQRHEQRAFDLDAIPEEDVRTFNMIRAGRTLGCFQIESQGQIHLLAQHQPETFRDLITEIALFRPGPLQGGMVHPFVQRRKGEEPVTYYHSSLEPVLRDTYGVILFQEQVLEVAHRFAGLSLEEADRFRQLMSKFRDPGEMESMRERFVEGALARGVDEELAHEVFGKVAGFVGYGFCQSHAAAFAQTVYQSAYLKRHHPAAFLAAVMQHRPGMYNLTTLQEEARRFGVETHPPDIHRSGLRYDVEPGRRGRLAIRMPLTAVQEVGEQEAQRIVMARLGGPFESIEDLYRRVRLPRDAFRALARSGAFDALAGSSRQALWELGVLERRLAAPGEQQKPALFEMETVLPEDVPALALLQPDERLSWDYEAHGAARRHPMTLVRRHLADLEVRPVETCWPLGRLAPSRNGRCGVRTGEPLVTVAGIVTLRQQPPTAGGVMFVTLEDETGFVQCVVPERTKARLLHVLGRGALIVRGRLQTQGNWRGLVVGEAWALDGLFGGYAGHPSAHGRDQWVRAPQYLSRSKTGR